VTAFSLDDCKVTAAAVAIEAVAAAAAAAARAAAAAAAAVFLVPDMIITKLKQTQYYIYGNLKATLFVYYANNNTKSVSYFKRLKNVKFKPSYELTLTSNYR